MPARIFEDPPPVEEDSVGGTIINNLTATMTANGVAFSLPTTLDDDVVISGISCRLPESDNIEEFRQHLMQGEDMVTDDDRRWPPGLFGLPKRSGKLKDISKFDASFFGVHGKQATSMDPQLRMLLETTQEALVDSGTNPNSIRGSKIGVFIGASASEAHEAWSADAETTVGYSMTGCTRSMFANRLSYFFDFKGPSFSVDTACSSSLLALDQAIHSIQQGHCEAAIVGGSSLCLKPTTSLQFQKLGMLSPEGTCKSFDVDGNGYCRSEGIVSIFIQKRHAAKRVYSTVVHSKTNSDGNKEQGITFPSGEVQKQLLREVYSEAGVLPSHVSYVEAHGTGTKVGDPQEVNTIADLFCKGREKPLLIGSVKSNMGHPEPASGLAAVAKVIISMEDGIIPPNLHFKSPNPDIPALEDGRIKVVTEKTEFHGGYVGVNSFGFGGSNVHAILASNSKKTEDTHVASGAKRLFVYSARSRDGLDTILSSAQNHSKDFEMHALMNETANIPTNVHGYRGYCVLNVPEKTSQIQQCPVSAGPVWYVFAGMGTQWHGMGKQMMEFEIFRNSIKRLDAILKPYGVSLCKLFMEGVEKDFEDTVNSFISIAAIQVALVDMLKVMGISPDGIVGHSVGELGCGYADGSLTAEETILAAYWRGRCIKESNLPAGGMAAVGLTWQEALDQCPAGVVPACHNSEDTVTISGPKDDVSKFVQELKERNVFAKEVNSSGVAFHSYYMDAIAPVLKEALEKVIKPKARSKRWVSSSIPEAQWNSELSKWSSADYHVNNLVSPVLFQEALKHVPKNAVVIEIAPHCLLQAILKRSLSSECCIVGLMKRGHPDNVEHFLSSLGKCYMYGVDFDPLKIYHAAKFPVSCGTPMLSSLVQSQWDHSVSWDVPTSDQFMFGGGGSGSVFEIDVSPESKDRYMVDHCIDGRVLFPATGYLVLAWKALAKMKGQVYQEMPVTFDDVMIHKATVLPNNGKVKFEVNIMPSSGEFEINENGSLTVSGKVNMTNEPAKHLCRDCLLERKCAEFEINSVDIYKGLRLRGYDYGPEFRGILRSTIAGVDGELIWNQNWVSFLDTMLQILVNTQPGNGLFLPTRIKSLRIDPTKHLEKVYDASDGQKVLRVAIDEYTNICVSGGVVIHGLHATVAPRRQHQQKHPTLEEFHFVPYIQGARQKSQPLGEYAELCNKLSRRCLVKLAGDPNGVPNKSAIKEICSQLQGDMGDVDFSQSEMDKNIQNDKCGILQTLQLLNSVKSGSEINSVLEQTRSSVLEDPLLQLHKRSEILMPCLDIVMENTLSSTLKVLEVDATDGKMFEKVIPHFLSHPMLSVDYTITDHSMTTISEDVDHYNINNVEWNIAIDPPASIKPKHLIVARHVLHKQSNISTSLKNLSVSLQDGGFLLVEEITQNFSLMFATERVGKDLKIEDKERRSCLCYCQEQGWETIFEQEGFDVIYKRSDGLLSTMFLLRKKCDTPMDSQTTLEVNNLDCSWFNELKSKLEEIQNRPSGNNLWLVANSESINGLVGMVNCLRQEPGGERVRCIFNADLTQDVKFPPAEEGYKKIFQRNLLMNVYRDGVWGSFRHITVADSSLPLKPCQHAFVNVMTKGDLSSLKWVESSLKYFDPVLTPSKELCDVKYAALNFRDIMLATGRLPPDAIPGDLALQDCILGMEFSGTDTKGKRIMGLVPAKGLATTVDVDKNFLWEVPDKWTLQEAATVPVVYATVYYALVVRGQIKRGDKVLIHSGSGGVGQAAISVALHHGCEVFTTVGSKEKKEYLQATFPQMADDHFSNSRDTSFETDILQVTKGKGVNLVLNSLSEDKLQASVRVLSQHGKFLEIGKFDLSNNTGLGMSVFLKNISFHGILLDALFEDDNSDWKQVSDLLTDGMKSGAVRPLKTTVFGKSQLEDAFRFMAQGKHIGKVIIKTTEDNSTQNAGHQTNITPAIPKSYCHPTKVYIITGGLGGFGLELAEWLVKHGAKKLVLTSRSGIKTGYQKIKMKNWKRKGITVEVSNRDVKTEEATKLLIQESEQLGPVGGVFHLAMVLRDGLMENQTLENFRAVCEPKVSGTVNLDNVTRRLCPKSLHWFVVFSSVSCGRGNAGQANYGFANSVMERVCESRKHNGFPGLAIQWGAIGDVGVVLETMGNNDTVVGGTLPQRMSSCLSVLDLFLNQSHPVMSSFVLADKESDSRVQAGAQANLVDSICHILGINDVSTINPGTSLGDLGLDSLMGVEIKQTLERDFDLNFSMVEVRQLTVQKLQELSIKSDKPSDKTLDSGDVLFKNKEAFLRYDIDQLIPEDTLTLLKENDTSAPTLFIVHPLEGGCKSLHELVSKLQYKVYGLQCTANVPLSSVEEMANYYIQQIKTVQSTGPYTLAGYSFGACIAFEMCVQLEQAHGNKDVIQSLFLLDGSHTFVSMYTQTYKEKYTIEDDKKAETEAMCAFVRQFCDENYLQLSGELISLSSLDDRAKLAAEKLDKTGLFKDLGALAEAAKMFYQRLIMAEKYKPLAKVQSNITLVKASDIEDKEDYGLAEVCSGQVEIHTVKGDHGSFIRGDNAVKVATLMAP